MKYIILQDSLGGRHPVLFHDHLTHSIVAKGVIHAYQSEGKSFDVESAGFWDPEEMITHGRSESLNLDPLPGDNAYIFIGGSISYLSRDMVTSVINSLGSGS